jgi:hypothetical protein
MAADALSDHGLTLASFKPETIEKLKTAAEDKKGVDPTRPVSLALERLRAERAFAGSPASSRRPAAVDLLFGDLSDPVIGFLRLLGRLRS